MALFVFFPVCDITQVTLSCSNAWIMYFLFGILTAVTLRNVILTFFYYACLLIGYFLFTFGIPWYELTWHYGFGSIVGWSVVYQLRHIDMATTVPLNVPGNFSKFMRLTLVYVSYFFVFYPVDQLVIENGMPYGLVLSFIFCLVWFFVASAFLFCVEGVKNQEVGPQYNYWHIWILLAIALLLSFSVGFIPSLTSYIKSAILLVALIVIFSFEIEWHLKSVQPNQKLNSKSM